MTKKNDLQVTIGIKALNEERNIARCLESAIKAAESCKANIILADSGSSDQTVDIALHYPQVRIVQLVNTSERSCGTGAQLAYQEAYGDYFYILDGDMVLEANFLPAAIQFLEENPSCAAVGGTVREANLEGHEFEIRAATTKSKRDWLPGIVDRLDCGGLYRMSAIREVAYFADRNLRAFEEFDLAARLHSAGWKLARIDQPAVEHYGHTIGGYSLLLRRALTGYSSASGQVLRAAFRRPHLPIVLRRLSHIRNALLVLVWWLSIIGALFAPIDYQWRIGLIVVLVAAPLLALAFRRGSLRLGTYSFVAWNFSALGFLAGLVRSRRSPLERIESKQLSP